MIIRKATQQDLYAIAELSRELALHVDDKDPGDNISILHDNLFGKDNWAECFVAVQNDDVIGFATVCRQFEAHTRRRYLWLSDLAVSKGHQKQGIGRLLIEYLKQIATQSGCNGLNFELWVENHSAKPFYNQLGADVDNQVSLYRLSCNHSIS